MLEEYELPKNYEKKKKIKDKITCIKFITKCQTIR